MILIDQVLVNLHNCAIVLKFNWPFFFISIRSQKSRYYKIFGYIVQSPSCKSQKKIAGLLHGCANHAFPSSLSSSYAKKMGKYGKVDVDECDHQNHEKAIFFFFPEKLSRE